MSGKKLGSFIYKRIAVRGNKNWQNSCQFFVSFHKFGQIKNKIVITFYMRTNRDISIYSFKMQQRLTVADLSPMS